MKLKRFARLGPLLAAALAVGCAQERPPINRVQADALSKHFFVGDSLSDSGDDPEFYWRNYVVDGPVSQSLAGVGSWSGVDRIRWEVTEGSLIARKAYQLSQGADNHGAALKDPNGIIVASYKIVSHFDIRRAYNPTTGEEQNVVEENTSDRPWYQREYFRVDWSSNNVDNPFWEDMFAGKVFGNISLTPLAYYDNDPASDNAPHFDAAQGYFDITNHYSVAPAETASPFSDLKGKVPTCLLVGLFTGSATYDCNAQEAIVRSSYLRLDPSYDFESLENTQSPLDVIGNPGGIGDSFEAGIVTPGQQGWDPGYGYVDKLYHRFAHVHNNWVQSHQAAACTANDDTAGSGTADQCVNTKTGYTGSKGSQCDTFVGKCTIPYRDRQIKPIGYWVNKEMPADLQDPLDSAGNPSDPTKRGAAEDLAYSWNQLMSAAIARGREVECRRTGDGDRPTCHAKFFNDNDANNNDAGKVMLSYGGWLVNSPKEATPALVLCHNPVRAYDRHDTCGATGYQARVGDLRHNFIFYWPYDSRAPWGGIANWNADPLTGRIIGAAAQIMGRSATYAAAMQRDILQLAMGDTTVQDITDGIPSDNYAHYLKNGFSPAGLTSEEIKKRVAAIDADHMVQSVNAKPLAGATPAEKATAFFKMQAETSADPLEQSTSQLEFQAIVKPLLGTRFEADMVDSHWLVGALGMDPTTTIDSSVLDQASPLRGLDSGRLNAWRELMQEKLRLRGMCYMDSEAPIAGSIDMAGLGGYFKAKYASLDPVARGQAMYHDLWVEAFKGIAIHEVGHSLGMLHQFASSWDAPNFNPQYWQLRTGETATLGGTGSAKSCNAVPRAPGDRDTCMGPRYLDPETTDEQGLGAESRPGIEYFGNTSVMEYQIERFGETVGLGTYDEHVMNALYGRVLETMDPDALGFKLDAKHPTDPNIFAPRMESQLGEQDRIIRPATIFAGSPVFAWPAHYTETARLMSVFDPARDCRPATAAEATQAEWRLVHGKVCAPAPRDHASWRDFVLADPLPSSPGGGAGAPAPYWHTNTTTKTGPGAVRWFYRWGTNHNAYFHTNDSDAGADPYEVTVNTVAKFDISYPFGYFRRHNREYQYMNIPSSVSDRYFERVRSYHWIAANNNAFYGGNGILQAINVDDWQLPYTLAETEMFNLLTRALLMPEPGGYQSAPNVPTPVDVNKSYYDVPQFAQGSPSFTIGAVDGRFIGEEYNSNPDGGGSWDYLHWMNHAGFSTEKAFAARALSDGRPNLFTINRANFLDGRAVKINFRNDLPQALDRLIGGILSEDWDTVAPYVLTKDGHTPQPRLIDLTAAAPVRAGNPNLIFPNIGYKQQLDALIFVEAFSRLNSDMTLVNKLRVWIDGQVGQINVPEAQQIRFYDPNSGYTYVARKYGPDTIDGKVVDQGIASRMLTHANALLVASYVVQTDNNGNAVVDKFGTPQLQLDANGQPQIISGGPIGTLTNYVGLLDATRQIGVLLGYGPLGGAVGGGGGDE